MEDIGDRVGLVPACGKPGLELVVLVSAYERVEDEHVDALRLRVDADPRIEACRAGLDEHDGGIRVGFAAASGRSTSAHARSRVQDTATATFRHR